MSDVAVNESRGVLRSVRVGQPAERPADAGGRAWETAMFKEPVAGPVALGPLGLEGDGVADTVHHGGPDKAVCVYPTSRLPYWAARLAKPFDHGAFGENLSLGGLDEATVCVGDVFTVGNSGARVQVSQPRSPCWKLARRWGDKRLALWVQQTGFTGWYFRVLAPGPVAVGDAVQLEARPHPGWSIARINQVEYHDTQDADAADALAGIEVLTTSWRDAYRARVGKLRA